MTCRRCPVWRILLSLDLGGTQVRDVAALAGMRELRSLDLEGTQVADVTPLAGLPALRSVAWAGRWCMTLRRWRIWLRTAASMRTDRAVDPVLFWNDQTNRSIQVDWNRCVQGVAGPGAGEHRRAGHAEIDRRDAGFPVRLPAPRDIPFGGAAAAAAHAVLVHLFPARQGSAGCGVELCAGDERPDRPGSRR